MLFPEDELDPEYGQREWTGTAFPAGPASRWDPERIAIGEPARLRVLRELALMRLQAQDAPMGIKAEQTFNEAMRSAASDAARSAALQGRGVPVPATPAQAEADLAALRGEAAEATREQALAERGAAAGEVMRGEDWRMRQRALMEGIRTQKLERARAYREGTQKAVREGMGTIISIGGGPWGGVVGALARGIGGAMRGGEPDADLATGKPDADLATVDIYDPDVGTTRRTRARREIW